MMLAADPERTLALSYAPVEARAALAALLALDDTLAQILRTTREPLIGQMRMTWWFDALSALDIAVPPAQPVLQSLASDVVSLGLSGAELAKMIEGWEALLDPEPLNRERLESYGEGRGARLFRLAGRVLGAVPSDPLDIAGAGWALADLGENLRDPVAAEMVRLRARSALASIATRRWSRSTRALGALALIARMNVQSEPKPSPAASPRRVARLAWHRLSGR